MWEDAQFVHHVVFPNDIRVLGTDLRFRFSGSNHILRFVHERAVVAIGLAVYVQADNFATARYKINPIAFNRWRGKQSEVFPVVDFARWQLGHNELPQKFAGLLVKDHQNASVALMLRVAWRVVVRSDEYFSSGHGDVAVALRTELGHPLHILRGAHVDFFGPGLRF